jgi:hypothetical protein
MLAWRARARAGKGDHPGASDDQRTARALLDDMAGRITEPALRAAFEADPTILEVRRRW